MFDEFNKLFNMLVTEHFDYLVKIATDEQIIPLDHAPSVTGISGYVEIAEKTDWIAFTNGEILLTIDFIKNGHDPHKAAYILNNDYSADNYKCSNGSFVDVYDHEDSIETRYSQIFNNTIHKKLIDLFIDNMIDKFQICPITILPDLDAYIINRMNEKNYININYRVDELVNVFEVNRLHEILSKEAVDIFMF